VRWAEPRLLRVGGCEQVRVGAGRRALRLQVLCLCLLLFLFSFLFFITFTWHVGERTV
jgi:hypothetical protein